MEHYLKLYHGSSKYFENFNQEGLGFNSGQMAVTAGYYFTTNKEEALNYANSENEKGYLYQVDLSFKNKYKAGFDPEYVEEDSWKKVVLLDQNNNISRELHQNITIPQIKSILKSHPNWKEKLLDYEDIDINNRNQVNNALRNVANIYKEIFKENFLDGFNVLGNDWFNENVEMLNLYNQTFVDKVWILGFAKEFDDGNLHFVFLDYNDIPELKITNLSLENEIDLELQLNQQKNLKKIENFKI